MSKFRVKPVVVEATRWWKNGDHPEDESRVVTSDGEVLMKEGRIVRYYRVPILETRVHPCIRCLKPWDEHGWIDTNQGGHVVCPGDWIIVDPIRGFFPCNPDFFAAIYEPAEDER